MTYDKFDTKDTLCDDRDNTCATLLTTLGMSVMNVYMVISTHLHKDNPLKPPKQAYINRVTINMWKDNIFPFLQKGPQNLEKTHTMVLNICDNTMHDQDRLRNLVQAKILEGVVATITLSNTLVEFQLYVLVDSFV